MLAILALGSIETLFNQWIDLDAATRQQLNALSGKLLRVVIDSPQLSVDVWFDQDKVRLSPTVLGMAEKPSIFEQRPYDPVQANTQTTRQATTTLQVTTLVELLSLLTAKAGATGNIPLQGDMSLLQQLQRILAQASPDLASRLSPWIGANAAGQLGSLIDQSQKTASRVFNSLTSQGVETLTEDSQLFVARWQMDQFNRELRQLRQDIERAQARSQQLQHRVELSQLSAQQRSGQQFEQQPEPQLAKPLDAQSQNKP